MVTKSSWVLSLSAMGHAEGDKSISGRWRTGIFILLAGGELLNGEGRWGGGKVCKVNHNLH